VTCRRSSPWGFVRGPEDAAATASSAFKSPHHILLSVPLRAAPLVGGVSRPYFGGCRSQGCALFLCAGVFQVTLVLRPNACGGAPLPGFDPQQWGEPGAMSKSGARLGLASKRQIMRSISCTKHPQTRTPASRTRPETPAGAVGREAPAPLEAERRSCWSFGLVEADADGRPRARLLVVLPATVAEVGPFSSCSRCSWSAPEEHSPGVGEP
jgi:hypothetical protein